jgi:rhodanese-related sulfurtransferase
MNVRSRLLWVAAAVALVGMVIAEPSFAASDGMNVTVLSAAENLLAAMPDDYYTVKPVRAEKAIAAGDVLVIDVREPKEFEAEYMTGARNIPIRKLIAMIDVLPRDRQAPILIYCRIGHRGAIGLTILRMLGYTDVRNLSGGLEAWKAGGLPLAK